MWKTRIHHVPWGKTTSRAPPHHAFKARRYAAKKALRWSNAATRRSTSRPAISGLSWRRGAGLRGDLRHDPDGAEVATARAYSLGPEVGEVRVQG